VRTRTNVHCGGQTNASTAVIFTGTPSWGWVVADASWLQPAR
jgi:hypothetical protein